VAKRERRKGKLAKRGEEGGKESADPFLILLALRGGKIEEEKGKKKTAAVMASSIAAFPSRNWPTLRRKKRKRKKKEKALTCSSLQTPHAASTGKGKKKKKCRVVIPGESLLPP